MKNNRVPVLNKYTNKIIIFMVCSFCINLSFALFQDTISLFFLFGSFVIPIVLFRDFLFLQKTDFILWIFVLAITFACFFHFNRFRFTSYIYMIMYVVYFICFVKLLKRNTFTTSLFVRFIKFILVSYFIVIAIQQVMVLCNIGYVFNAIATDGLRLNSLAHEPSYVAITLIIAILSLVKIREIESNRKFSIRDFSKDKCMWLIFLYVILTCGSSSGYLFLMILLMKFVRFKTVFIFGVISGFFILLLNYYEVNEFIRIRDIILAFFTLDQKQLLEADHSAAIRIVPTMIYIDDFSIMDLDTWFGYGIDYAKSYIPEVIPGIPEDGYQTGFFPTFPFNMGIVNTFIILYIIYKNSIINFFTFDTLIFVLCIGVVSFSTQMFWYSVFMFAITRNLQKKYIFIK